MTVELDAPAAAEEIYRDRGDVAFSVPVMQGDVFEGVRLDALGGQIATVMVVMHPCSLRQGPVLRQRITVAPVTALADGITQRTWKRSRFNFMLLPDMRENGDNYVCDLREMESARVEELTLARRVSALSADGLLLLQQRIAFYHTRFMIDLRALGEAAAPVVTENEMLESWLEAALDSGDFGDRDEASLDELSLQTLNFHAWLDEDEGRRRQRLAEQWRHAELRREEAQEIAQRFTVAP